MNRHHARLQPQRFGVSGYAWGNYSIRFRTPELLLWITWPWLTVWCWHAEGLQKGTFYATSESLSIDRRIQSVTLLILTVANVLILTDFGSSDLTGVSIFVFPRVFVHESVLCLACAVCSAQLAQNVRERRRWPLRVSRHADLQQLRV